MSDLKALGIDPKMDSLMSNRRWVYMVDQSEPDPHNEANSPRRYRVSIVIEGVAGHFPMGDPKKKQSPWWWTESVCERQNADRGFNAEQVWDVISSSMAAGRVADNELN